MRHSPKKNSFRIKSWIAGCVLLSAISSPVSAALPSYTEVSAAAGISSQAEVNGMAAGIGWIDYNNDGWQDLYIPAASAPNRLYKNNGDGTFTEIAATAGVTGGGGLAVSVGDYDGDGFDDLLVVGSGTNTLFRNKGDGTFENVSTAAGITQSQIGQAGAASFGDVDDDGDLDLFIGKWFIQTSPVVTCPIPVFYLNNGDGTFTDKTIEAGLADAGCTFDNPMTDYDRDGDLDILEVNDTLVGTFPQPKVYRNDGINAQGVPQFTAVEIGLFDGLFTGMGIAMGDYNNDGDLDYSMPQFGDGILSTNNGDGTFTASNLPSNGKGWGATFLDADNDGYLDLYRGNTNAGFSSPVGQPNVFYENNGDGTFTRDTLQQAGLESIGAGLGTAAADYDNDGDMDVVVHGQDGTVNLFRNDTVTSNNWVEFNLAGLAPNHRGIGARVTIVTTNGTATMTQVREVAVGGGHGSSKALPLLFGLGDHDQIKSVNVVWPGGCRQVYSSGINQINSLTEKACHTISGTVAKPNGAPVQGIKIQVADNFGLSTYVSSDVNGFYSALVPNGTYIVFGSSTPDYSVSCGFIFVGVNGADVTKNCTATWIGPTISGTVTDTNGQPVPGIGVQVADNFGFSETPFTDQNGFYSVDVTAGTYIVFGNSNSQYSVSCGFIFVSVGTESVTKNCTATPN